MSIWGKVIGGVAGFAMGGPIGALVGAVAGHAVDRLREDAEPAQPRIGTGGPDAARMARQVAFTAAVIVLGAKMAKADGAVVRAEIDAFKQVFRIPQEHMADVGRLFNEARRDAGGFEPYARQVAAMFRNEPAVLEELLAGLVHIARADGELRPAELAFIQRVAVLFGLDQRAFDRVCAAHDNRPDKDPYEVLGIGREASNDEIKRHYRKLMRENHPDTLMARGLPQDFADLATEKVAAINAAYDHLAKERGIR